MAAFDGFAVQPLVVAAEVQRRLPMLEQCYQRRLAANPALAGTIGIHWYITETGEVPESCITEDTTGDAELAACVNVLVTTGVFPKPRGGTVDVLFPFVFNAPTTVAQN